MRRDGKGRNGTGRDGTGRDGTGRDGMPCHTMQSDLMGCGVGWGSSAPTVAPLTLGHVRSRGHGYLHEHHLVPPLGAVLQKLLKGHQLLRNAFDHVKAVHAQHHLHGRGSTKESIPVGSAELSSTHQKGTYSWRDSMSSL